MASRLLTPYVELLRPRAHWMLVGSGLIARVPSAILGFSTLLLVQKTTGSFALGGLVAGAVVLSRAIVGPVLGRIADRNGQRLILRWSAVVHIVSVASLLILAELKFSPILLVAVGVIAGGSLAPIGSFTRARWTHIYRGEPLLNTAFALESILEDLVWIFGPAAAAYISATVNPGSGLILSGICGFVGCWLLSIQGFTDTPVPHVDVPKKKFHPLASGRIIAILLSGFAVGLAYGINDISAIAMTREDGIPAYAGFIVGVFSIGSVIGGVVYGTIAHRRSPYRMFVGATIFMAVTWLPLALAPNTFWVMGVGLIAGTAAAPFAIAANRAVEASSAPEVVTEALAWVVTTIVAGMALGSLLGGFVIDSWGARGGFVAVSILMTIPVFFALAGARGTTSAISPSPEHAMKGI
jgi:MFS family permease